MLIGGTVFFFSPIFLNNYLIYLFVYLFVYYCVYLWCVCMCVCVYPLARSLIKLRQFAEDLFFPSCGDLR